VKSGTGLNCYCIEIEYFNKIDIVCFWGFFNAKKGELRAKKGESKRVKSAFYRLLKYPIFVPFLLKMEQSAILLSI
jgi:hypothetical protein